MSTQIEINGLAEIKVRRNDDDEFGGLVLTIEGEDGTTVDVDCGRFYDDAETLRSALADAAFSVAHEILDGWEDRPDEFDGYVGFDSGAYHVSLEGKQVGHRDGYPTQDIAMYELARAMADAGVFPNVWYVTERGYTDSIEQAVRSFHDEGGDKLRPLPGVEYEEDDTIRADGWKAYVVTDYGDLGITYVLSGDDTVHFSEDRDGIEPYEESEDGEQ